MEKEKFITCVWKHHKDSKKTHTQKYTHTHPERVCNFKEERHGHKMKKGGSLMKTSYSVNILLIFHKDKLALDKKLFLVINAHVALNI